MYVFDFGKYIKIFYILQLLLIFLEKIYLLLALRVIYCKCK